MDYDANEAMARYAERARQQKRTRQDAMLKEWSYRWELVRIGAVAAIAVAAGAAVAGLFLSGLIL